MLAFFPSTFVQTLACTCRLFIIVHSSLVHLTGNSVFFLSFFFPFSKWFVFNCVGTCAVLRWPSRGFPMICVQGIELRVFPVVLNESRVQYTVQKVSLSTKNDSVSGLGPGWKQARGQCILMLLRQLLVFTSFLFAIWEGLFTSIPDFNRQRWH